MNNELDYDINITKVTQRKSAGGTWVNGTIDGHRFEALVFPEHAECREWEIGDSRISKLWLQRAADTCEVFCWDRGSVTPAANATAAAIVDFLAEGLADLIYA